MFSSYFFFTNILGVQWLRVTEAGGFIALTTKDHPQETTMKISVVHVFT